MKTEILVLGLAAVAVFLIMKAKPVSAAGKPAAPNLLGTYEIKTGATPGGAGWGWKYYSDGTAISPDGIYYHNGVEVWRP